MNRVKIPPQRGIFHLDDRAFLDFRRFGFRVEAYARGQTEEHERRKVVVHSTRGENLSNAAGRLFSRMRVRNH